MRLRAAIRGTASSSAHTCLSALAVVALLGFSRTLLAGEYSSENSKCQRLHVVPTLRVGITPPNACSCADRHTIVTAFFRAKFIKHTSLEYETWNRRFLSLPDDMVIFTDSASVSSIRKARSKSPGCTIIVKTSLRNTELSSLVDWSSQHAKDPEKRIHTPDLYIIWNHKSLWLADVAELNPYQSSHFFWADSGQFRDEAFINNFMTEGEKWVRNTDFLPNCTIVFISIKDFQESELFLNRRGNSQPLDSSLIRLGGGNFGGDRCALRRWKTLFIEKLKEYVASELFAGKDQPIYGSICIEHRDLCFLIEAQKVLETKDVWFAMQPVLHGSTKVVPEYVLPRQEDILPRLKNFCRQLELES